MSPSVPRPAANNRKEHSPHRKTGGGFPLLTTSWKKDKISLIWIKPNAGAVPLYKQKGENVMKRHFNLYYLFWEEKEQLKLSQEKSAEIWSIIEAFFCALKKIQPTLPMDKEEG